MAARFFRLAALPLLAILTWPGPGQAADRTPEAIGQLCKQTLSSPQESYDYLAREQFARTVITSICKITFDDRESLKKAADALHIPLELTEVLFSLGPNDIHSDLDSRTAYYRFCTSSGESPKVNPVIDLDSGSFSRTMRTIQNFCIAQLPTIYPSVAPNGMVLRVTSATPTEFTINLQDYKMRPVKYIDSVSGAKACLLGDEAFKPGPGERASFKSAAFSITGTCVRNSPNQQTVQIGTQWGLSNAISIPAAESTTADLQNMKNSLDNQIGKAGSSLLDAARGRCAVERRLEGFRGDQVGMVKDDVTISTPGSSQGMAANGFYAVLMDVPVNRRLIAAWYEPLDNFGNLAYFSKVDVGVIGRDHATIDLRASGNPGSGKTVRLAIHGLYGPENF